jgi:hypothetical protein
MICVVECTVNPSLQGDVADGSIERGEVVELGILMCHEEISDISCTSERCCLLSGSLMRATVYGKVLQDRVMMYVGRRIVGS